MNEITSTTDGSRASGTGLSAEQEGLRLPAGMTLLERLGRSRWSTVYKAAFQGETIALKAYTDNAANWYRKKLDKNIAVFEMLQNRSFRSRPELLPYTAKPIRVIGQDGKASLCFLQEYVDGITLEDLGREHGRIPGYVMQTGESIARYCEENDVAGIDQFMSKVLFRKENNAWVPVMFDFKQIPEEPKKPAGPTFLSRLGIGARQDGPSGFMRDWKALDEKFQKS